MKLYVDIDRVEKEIIGAIGRIDTDDGLDDASPMWVELFAALKKLKAASLGSDFLPKTREESKNGCRRRH